MRAPLIPKTAADLRVAPNMGDWAATRAAFSWDAVRQELCAGAPDSSEGAAPDFNLARLAVDRHALGPLAQKVALRLVSTDVPAEVAGRAVLCRPLTMFPVECVARGYLAGSGLADYLASGSVCGVPLPAGLVDGSVLPEPVFTPATKAAMGEHDENVSYDEAAATVPSLRAPQIGATEGHQSENRAEMHGESGRSQIRCGVKQEHRLLVFLLGKRTGARVVK